MVGSDASLIPPSSNVGSVLESTGSAGLGEEDLAVSLDPQTEDGGPPYLLIGGLLAVLILLAGVGLAAYTYYYNRDPPLVDIRHYR